ncbi:immune inhibitor A domain-containing protein [Paraferrimonas haliotis]|uniref:immune inhibitor A domain-containing protein n=1 Tax=Paraferrimonas haliotis TaxID=2013866 RepID=UPI000BA9533D|nr:immune inhibitor A domain-containing protein [Paraferrimonas haliotis]
MMRFVFFALTLASLTVAGVSFASPIPLSKADPALVNKERIEYWLRKNGELSPESQATEVSAAVDNFIAKADFAKPYKEMQAALQQPQNRWLTNNRAPAAATLMSADTVTTKNVLAIMIDFPDLPHDANRLSAGDTEMFYPSYPVEHYQNLLFNPNGFRGPNGQTLESVHQYYQQESGNRMNFNGTAFGWFTAQNNAQYYGENDPDNNDDDKAAGELAIEAVTKLYESGQSDLSEFDRDGDKIIDHLMIFHSSIGEETGGGVLGSNAIWSHRFAVLDGNNRPVAIGDSGYSILYYTIQPIDAGIGVCAHEFGHDMGLPDEYDLAGSAQGEPVGFWSLMSAGSYVGNPSQSKPASMSPYARRFLQQQMGGRWVTEQRVDFDQLGSQATALDINHANDKSGNVDLLTIELPKEPIPFSAPFTGDYQYYSTTGDQIDNRLTLPQVAIPALGNSRLTFMAWWKIEEDYDVVQLLVNGRPISTSASRTNNPYYAQLGPYFSGNSAQIAGAQGDLGWVEVSADLNEYAGQTVQLQWRYQTDNFVYEDGMVIDDIRITNNGAIVFEDGAEIVTQTALSGFYRSNSDKPGEAHRYLVELRSHLGNDEQLGGRNYSPGLLIWYRNEAYSNNNVDEHPGFGFLGVVDADQTPIRRNGRNLGSSVQIQDAAFSLYPQLPYVLDTNLAAIPRFDDSLDYSFPSQPQSGLQLPKLGLQIELTSQVNTSERASVNITRSATSTGDQLAGQLSAVLDGMMLTASVDVNGGQAPYQVTWDFGDGSSGSGLQVSHTYAAAASYQVTATITDADGNQLQLTRQVEPIMPLAVSINTSVSERTLSFSAQVSGGDGQYSYAWDFGDGNSSNQASGQHTYQSDGSYTVSLTATDGLGNRQQSQTNLTISSNTGSESTQELGGDGGGAFYWLLVLLTLIRLHRK